MKRDESPLLISAQESELPPKPNRIFVNRNLRLDCIKAIGFDMDYTLARYHRQHFEELAHRLTLQKLVQHGYPDHIMSFAYNPHFVVRGLIVDRQLGNIIKIDRHNHVGRVFHGSRQLSKNERREVYRREKLRFVPPRFALVDTLFSLPEMCIYADLVDYFDKLSPGQVDYWQLYEDTRNCIDEAHRDDTLKSIVKADVSRYIERDPLLARTLHKLRSSGKKLFLLTNSHLDYTQHVMTYLLENQMPEAPQWQRYFDAVIVAAAKPGFFTKNEPLFEIDPTSKIISNSVIKLEKGHLYQGGNLKQFEDALGVSGEEILYIGDHIYGDILRSKKTSLWRTALIVEELEEELANMQTHKHDVQHLANLELERQRLDNLVNFQRQELALLGKPTSPDDPHFAQYEIMRSMRDQNKLALKAVIEEMQRLEDIVGEGFNPYWGMVFKEDRENSRFGDQVVDYACIYTSRVTNFVYYSSYQYFRSPRDMLPHERD